MVAPLRSDSQEVNFNNFTFDFYVNSLASWIFGNLKLASPLKSRLSGAWIPMCEFYNVFVAHLQSFKFSFSAVIFSLKSLVIKL